MISKKSMFLILLLILVAGSLLRLYQLDKESLWIDEAFTASYARGSLQGLINGLYETEGAPPGHYLLLHYWIKLFGDSAYSLRFPSVIFGVASIILMYQLGAMLFSRKTGLIAALLLSTSMLQVLFSQEARLYSLYGFLVLSTACFFVMIIKMEPGKKKVQAFLPFAGYFFFLVLALYVNYLALFLIAIYTLLAWLNQKDLPRKFFRNWILAHLLVVLAALPLLNLFLGQFAQVNTGLAPELVKRGLPSLLASLGVFFYALPLLALVLILVFLISSRKKTSWNFLEMASHQAGISEGKLVLMLACFGAIYAYLSVYPLTLFGIHVTRFPLTHSYFLIRHSYFLVPVFYLLVSARIANFRSRKLAAFALLLLVSVNSFSFYQYYSQPTKAQWQEAVEFIELQSTSDSPIILLDKGGFSSRFLLDYYSQDYSQKSFSPREIRLAWSEGKGKMRRVNETALVKVLDQQDDFWLVLSAQYERDNYFRDLLDEIYLRDISKEFYRIGVYHYTIIRRDRIFEEK